MVEKEFFANCDKETENVIKLYLLLMNNLTNKDGELKRKYYTNYNFDTFNNFLYYLLYIIAISETNTGKILRKNMKLEVSNSVMKKIYNESLPNLDNNASVRELFVASKKNRNALMVIETYAISENKDKLTLDKLLLSILENQNIIKTFKLEDLQQELINPKAKNKRVIKPVNNLSFGEFLTNINYVENPLVGRSKELRNMCALLTDAKKSVIIYGGAGVGKTTLIKGLAYNIQNNATYEYFKDKKIFSVSASELIQGTNYRGTLEEKVNKLVSFLKNNPNTILFIDEIHLLMGLGRSEGSIIDVPGILLSHLGEGSIKIIGATTKSEVAHIMQNSAFERRFNFLEIPELNDEEKLNILLTTIASYEKNYNIKFGFDDEITMEIIKLILYITDKIIDNKNSLTTKDSNNINYYFSNPDYMLTMLNNCYNFARLDGKEALDINYLIEGIKFTKGINESISNSFIKEVNYQILMRKHK